MKLAIKLVGIGCLALMVGCAAPARFENMVYTQTLDNAFDSEMTEQVEVIAVQGGSETNPLWVSKISSNDFQKALEESLRSRGLLANNGRFNLKVTLLEVIQPMFGLDLKVVTKVSYIVVDNDVGEVLFDEIVEATHTATFSDAFDAVTRLRIANEGSGKNNIKSFLERLSTLNIESSQLSLTGENE
tara:strand:+ start:760 stop:1320 length:561 start_codon:yes stop_codon:yes gene_type:complete